ISSLNCVAMRSRTERRCNSPSARSTVSLLFGSCSTTKVGSSAVSRCSTSQILCSSPRFFGASATPCIGVGNSSGRMWMWSSSCAAWGHTYLHEVLALAVDEPPRISSPGIPQQFHEHVQPLRDAGAVPGGNETHRYQVPLAQRFLERRMKLIRRNLALL